MIESDAMQVKASGRHIIMKDVPTAGPNTVQNIVCGRWKRNARMRPPDRKIVISIRV